MSSYLLDSSGIASTTAKVDHTYATTMNEDFTPLLVATPLYGATEPETVIFDESAVLPTTTFVYDDRTVQEPLTSIDPLMPQATPTTVADYSESYNKPEEAVYRDVPFAILFWIQFAIMMFLGFHIAPKGYDMMDLDTIKQELAKDPDTSDIDVKNFETVVAFMATYLQTYPQRILTCLLYPTTFVAFLIALIITTKIIRPFPKFMVTFCLVGWFVHVCIFMGILLISSFSIISLTVAVGALAITAYYIRVSWRLIPHSAVNLGVSLEGVQANCGIYIVALCLAETGFMWVFYWLYTVVGTIIYIGETQCPNSEDGDACGPQSGAFLFMVLSLYWTGQVITVGYVFKPF
jgi:Plasma-membrane choline transporter